MSSVIRPLFRHLGMTLLVLCCCASSATRVWPQIAQANPEQDRAASDPIKTGYLVDVPTPLSGDDVNVLIAQLAGLAGSAAEGQRATVVMRYPAADQSDGSSTGLEDALKLARAMTSTQLRRLKIVSWVRGEITGHSVLPILASDSLLVSPGAALGDATASETAADETIPLIYHAIAERRSLFPPAVVLALADPTVALVRATRVDGGRQFAAGPSLEALRESGNVLEEEVWSPAGSPLRLQAEQLREARIAARIVGSLDKVAEGLDLAELKEIEAVGFDGERQGALLEITGSISPNRSQRWQSNLAATLETGQTNVWLVAVDSSGGSFTASAALAGWFAEPEPPLQAVAGLIRNEARGDAALIALACKPLLMTPNSTLGGPGSQAISVADVRQQDELIEMIARQTNRSPALIRGLLDRESKVYRFTNKKTGRVRYATEAGVVEGAEDAQAERDRWQRGERIELSDGLSADEAIALGLADGEAQSLEAAAESIGLPAVPPRVADRSIVRFVERIGRSSGLAFLLLFIGFIALSSEASAPGLGVPGFISVVCFALFFWIKFLAGTAEWLELLAFVLGISFIAIEVFVLPGFGVFGIGGLVLTVLGVVLMSQTFVIPRNVYQVEVLTQGIWVALGGAFGMIAGVMLIRTMLPHTPILRGLLMETPDAILIDRQERLADYSHLEGQSGTAATPLRPSGKAQFGDQIVAVVSDGTVISPGDPVRVVEIHGTRIVVEAVES